MIFIVCWSCGYSTRVRGSGESPMNTARRLKEEHKHAGSNTQIITQGDIDG